jgi:hypothetical protein
MSLDALTAAYIDAASAFEAADRAEKQSNATLVSADYAVLGDGSLMPGSQASISDIEKIAGRKAAAANAKSAHDAAVTDLAAKQAARDQAWAAVVAAS